MGTTVVVLKLHRHRYEVAWVGDSRVYLLRRGVLTQLTRDHSLVQDLLESGGISVTEAQSHPHRNIITRVLGGDVEPVVDRCSDRIVPGDLFLLCSDGLSNEIDDARIRYILTVAEGPVAAAADLVAAAVEAGGRDNISATVIAVD
jgi:protein phosphatase